MVNIAFPYKDMGASAMGTALSVLESMADNGNKYIAACHRLLTQIRSTIHSVTKGSANNEVPRIANTTSAPEAPQHRSDEGTRTHSQQAPGMHVTSESAQTEIGGAFDPSGLESDPNLWAELLDSIDIDMDRQWLGMALNIRDPLVGFEQNPA